MNLVPAPAGDGQLASSTWLEQRDMSLGGTYMVAFCLACAALPGEHSTHVPSRWADAAEEITHGAKCLRFTDAYFAPVLIFQEPPRSSFHGEEVGQGEHVT